jgi:hypothetical protein
MSRSQTAYWCVNFDRDAGPLGGQAEEYVLNHGLSQHVWLMHYQYAHSGHEFQDNPHQRSAITKNWKAAGRIRPGDWLAAYLPHQRFYAVGRVIRPRKQGTYRDTIRRTLGQRGHIHLAGAVVEYTDACGAFYEDFTDKWRLSLNNPRCASCCAHPNRRDEIWPYPQRVDVAEWQHLRTQGVRVPGIARAALSSYRCSAFPVTAGFFQAITDALRR